MSPRKTKQVDAPGEQSKRQQNDGAIRGSAVVTEEAIRREHLESMIASGIIPNIPAPVPPLKLSRKRKALSGSTITPPSADPVHGVSRATRTPPQKSAKRKTSESDKSGTSSLSSPPSSLESPSSKKRKLSAKDSVSPDSSSDTKDDDKTISFPSQKDDDKTISLPSQDEQVEERKPVLIKVPKRAAPKKRKVENGAANGSPLDGEVVGADALTAKKTNKRRAGALDARPDGAHPVQDTNSDRPAPKKRKTAVRRTKNTKLTTRNNQQPAVEQEGNAPNELTQPVLNKIHQVRSFQGPDPLDHHPDNYQWVSVPLWSLEGAVTLMRLHYELDNTPPVSMADVQGAIVYRFQKPEGTDHIPIKWVTLDTSVRTRLESRCQEKVAGYGMEGTNLLVTELAFLKMEELKTIEARREPSLDTVDEGKCFYETFERIWEKINAEQEALAWSWHM